MINFSGFQVFEELPLVDNAVVFSVRRQVLINFFERSGHGVCHESAYAVFL